MTEARYVRQVLFPPIGAEGQRRLSAARATLVGCGALGTRLAEHLTRAGVGALRICDRDFVEPENLAVQGLFDEADARERLPKAVAAARRLAAVNSAVRLEPRVVDVTPAAVEELIADADAVLDGTDNFETRFVLNDACVKRGKPWVYAACVASYGLILPVLPGETACLRCWIEELPPPGSSPTCDTAGVIGPAAATVAALAAAEALKILSGRREAVTRGTQTIDVWTGEHQKIAASRRPDCPACGRGKFEYLDVRAGGAATALCGRDAVQVSPASAVRLDLEELERRLTPVGRTQRNPYLVRFEADRCELTVFEDGRAIVKGTSDPARARTLYAKYVGA